MKRFGAPGQRSRGYGNYGRGGSSFGPPRSMSNYHPYSRQSDGGYGMSAAGGFDEDYGMQGPEDFNMIPEGDYSGAAGYNTNGNMLQKGPKNKMMNRNMGSAGAVGPSGYGPYSGYDAFYEQGPYPPRFPPPHAYGFTSPYGNYFPPGMYHTGSRNWEHQFLRTGKQKDLKRKFASKHELHKYFEMAREQDKGPVHLRLGKDVQPRLKKTFTYEISQCPTMKRKAWLQNHLDKITGPASTSQAGEEKASSGKVKKHVTVSASRKIKKNLKKRLKDKRPVQSEDERRVTNYLKCVLFELAGPEGKEHVVLVLRGIAFNPNMIQILMTECKTILDKKFGTENTPDVIKEKQTYIAAQQQNHVDQIVEVLVEQKKDFKKLPDSVYEKYNDLLVGIKDDPVEFATPQDYVVNKEKSEEDFIVDLKYECVRFSFEKFHLKIVNSYIKTESRRKRNNFFMNNGFLAGLILSDAKGADASLPSVAMKYMVKMDQPSTEASDRVNGNLLKKLQEISGYEVQTKVEDYQDALEKASATPDMIKLFGDCVRVFDPKASVCKYQLVEYTGYIGQQLKVNIARSYPTVKFFLVCIFFFLVNLYCHYVLNFIIMDNKPKVLIVKSSEVFLRQV